MSAIAPSSEASPILWLSADFPPLADVLRRPDLLSARALLRKPNSDTEGIVVSTYKDFKQVSLSHILRGGLVEAFRHCLRKGLFYNLA